MFDGTDNSNWILLCAWAAAAFLAMGWWVASCRLPGAAVAELDANWQARPLRFSLSRCDYLSLCLILGMLLLYWVGRRALFPVPPDGYYHLLVARNILDSDAIPLWNNWEFAPEGRPHLYPPLYHLLLALLGRLHGGDLLAGFQDLQCFVLPFVHFCIWWLARWLFDGPRALATLLLVGADPLLAITGMTAAPSIVAGGLVTLMLLFYISGHPFAAAGVGVAAFYMHTALTPLGLLGIALWCLWTRAPARPFLQFALPLLLLCAPWALWLIRHREWFHHPIDLGIYGTFSAFEAPFIKMVWLQLFNIGLFLLVFRGLRRMDWKDPRNRFLLACALAHLPILFSYGGRYFAHTVHLWAVIGGLALAPLFAAPFRKRAIAWGAAIALAPTAVMVGFGTVVPPGPIPMVSAWCFPPIVAAGGLKPLEHGEALGLFPYSDAMEAAKIVREQSSPESIIHTWGMNRDFALLMGFAAQRRIDTGGWEETMPGAATLEAIRIEARRDPSGIYVETRPGDIPPGREIIQSGSLYIGLPISPEDSTASPSAAE